MSDLAAKPDIKFELDSIFDFCNAVRTLHDFIVTKWQPRVNVRLDDLK